MSKQRSFNFLFGFFIIIFLINFALSKTCYCECKCGDVPGVFENVGDSGLHIESISKGEEEYYDFNPMGGITGPFIIQEETTSCGVDCDVVAKSYSVSTPDIEIYQGSMWRQICMEFCFHYIGCGWNCTAESVYDCLSRACYYFPAGHPIIDYLNNYPGGCVGLDPSDLFYDKKANNGNNLIDKKCLQGEPVNITTGNVYASAKDLHIPGRGFDLMFERSYNSQDSNEGPLGYGWTHNYNIFGYSLNDAQSILMDGTGTGLHFIKISSDIFVSSRNDGSKLTVNTDGTYTYIKKNGTKYLFDSTAKLIGISDKNSNTITLNYNINQNLVFVTDGRRQIRLAYNGNNKISALYGSGTPINPTGILASYNYDSIGNLVKVSYPDGSEINYNYDDPLDSHNLTSITNGAGYILAAYEYDDEDRAITSFSEGDLWQLSISYDSNTQTTVTDALGNSQVYTYRTIKGINVIEKITYPDNTFENFSWNYRLQNTDKTDRNGNQTTMTYNGIGDILTETDPLGNTTTFTYEPSFSQIQSITNADNKVTNFSYDDHGNLVSVTDPLGHSTTFQYNPYGDVISKTDASNNVTLYNYDSYGQIKEIINSKEYKEQYTYDNLGNRITSMDVNGNTTSYAYNIMNRLNKITYPDGTSNLYQYDDRGNIISIEDAKGNVASFNYNILDHLTKVIDPYGNMVIFTYDKMGNKTKEEIFDSANNSISSTVFQYNSDGRLVQITDGEGGTIQYTYDAVGNRLSMTDGNGNTTNYAYDENNRLTTTNIPGPQTVSYEYDVLENLIKVTDAKGNITNFTYDDLNRVVEIDSPDTGKTTYTYDSVGNLITKIDAQGETTTYNYDSLYRLTSIISSVTNQIIAYNYDVGTNGIGKLTTMSDPSGAVNYQYDNTDRLINETKNIASMSFNIHYEYDENGNISSMIYPGGRKIIYTYDLNNRITSINSDVGGIIKSLITDAQYRPFGPVKSLTYANGITTQITHNKNLAIEEMNIDLNSPTPLNRTYTYTYDPAQNITQISNFVSESDPGGSEQYSYDAFNQLIKWSTDSSLWSHNSIDFTYDQTGNRTSKTTRYWSDTGGIFGSSIYYTYNANKIAQISGGASFAHNPKGYLTSDGNFQYTYNMSNRLTSIENTSGEVAAYLYDGNGKRVKKKIGDEITYYFYDQNGQLICEITGDHCIDYIYVGDMLIARGEAKLPLTDPPPILDIRANGSDVPIALSSSNPLSITASLDPGASAGLFADWWVAADTPFGWYSYVYPVDDWLPGINLCNQTNLHHLPPFEVLNEVLTPGDYTFYFAIDNNADGIPNVTWLDSVNVHLGKEERLRTLFSTFEISYDFDLPAGWSMISLPLMPESYLVEDLFPDAVVVYGYEKGKGYERVSKLEVGKGYWILLDQAQSYTLTGQSIKDYTDTVTAGGWEMIGGCSSPAQVSVDNGNITVIYRYEQGIGYQRVPESENLNPGEGYWICITEPATINVESVNFNGGIFTSNYNVIPPINISSDKILFYHLNHLNTPIFMTDPNGTIVWQAEYAPFGEASINQDPDGDGNIMVSNFRFPGQYYDEESGLHYNMMRYYDPELGRYLQPDPIGFAAGDLNLYRYVLNNPVNFIDPDGLSPAGVVIKLSKKLWGKVMPGRPPYKKPRVKVYGDENTKNYLNTKIFPDGTVQSKSGLKVPKSAIEKATDALKVGAIFLVSLLNPFDAISGELAGDDMIPLPENDSLCQ